MIDDDQSFKIGYVFFEFILIVKRLMKIFDLAMYFIGVFLEFEIFCLANLSSFCILLFLLC